MRHTTSSVEPRRTSHRVEHPLPPLVEQHPFVKWIEELMGLCNQMPTPGNNRGISMTENIVYPQEQAIDSYRMTIEDSDPFYLFKEFEYLQYSEN